MIDRETVNSKGDRADLEGQNFLQLYRHAVQTSIGWQHAALVLIPCPDLRAVVLPGCYGANLHLHITAPAVPAILAPLAL